MPPLPPATFIRLNRSSIGILPPLHYHQNNLHSYHCNYQPTPCAFYRSTTTAPPCSTHVSCSRPITLRTHQSRGHESRSPQGPARIYVGILRHHLDMSLLVICSFYYHMLFTITPYMFMFCLYINTPVCCMYFASSKINLATYFSLTRSRLS